MRLLTRAVGATLLLGFGLAGCATPRATSTTSAAPVPSPAPTTQTATAQATTAPVPPAPQPNPCLVAAGKLELADQVGQLYMMAINAGTPVDVAISQLQTTRPGAVILLGNRSDGASVTAQYAAAVRAASPQEYPVLVAVDQEGGLVQRLQGPGFDRIPSATEQALLSDAELRAAWQQWGSQLREAGIDWDLAPVADVVPADQVGINEPVGQLQRGYGSDPARVAGAASAVIQGLTDAGLASSVKHFPGLGNVPRNTDFAVGHDQTSLLTEAELASFQAAIDAGASSVMVSSAIYTQVDPDNPAVFSSTILTGILRERMGFAGLVISDDLGAAASMAAYPVGDRGVGFLRAGGDMVIVADPGNAQTMVDATLAAAQADPAFAAELTVKVTRIFELKQYQGLMTC